MMYNMKRYALVNLEYGHLSVTEYEHSFIALASFFDDLYLLDSILEEMFENRLSSSIRDMVSSEVEMF